LNGRVTFLAPPAPVTLTGSLVELRPLARDHRDGLIDAVSEGELWKTAWYTSVPEPSGVAAEIDRRIALGEKGEMVPFTAFDVSGRVIGMTSYYDLEASVPRLHIGYTWNRPSAHGSGTNAESKLLLMTHAFETLGVYRVGLTTQWVNHQSRTAIERLGAKQDGVIRAISRYRNGALRDSVEYSIIQPEWSAVKATLEMRLAKRL
jgi:RimJ/RimL family protein N-acetyltransferase